MIIACRPDKPSTIRGHAWPYNLDYADFEKTQHTEYTQHDDSLLKHEEHDVPKYNESYQDILSTRNVTSDY